MPDTLRPTVTVRDVGPDDDAAFAAVGDLHAELLPFGPLAALGPAFLRTVCYRAPVRAGMLALALAEVDGVPAGFVAWTLASERFHAEAVRSHLALAARQAVLAVARDPRRLAALPRIARTARSRVDDGEDRGHCGEVIGLGVRPEFVTPAFRRRAASWLSRDLIAHAAAAVHREGRTELRVFVAAENTRTLMLYQMLGATFARLEHGGEPTVAASLDLPLDRVADGSPAE